MKRSRRVPMFSAAALEASAAMMSERMKGRKQPRLESGIEKSCCNYARDLGFKSKKLINMADRAWPDRWFVGPFACSFIVEFKKPGGELSPLQALNIKWLRDNGHRVYVVDDTITFRGIITHELIQARLAQKGKAQTDIVADIKTKFPKDIKIKVKHK